MQEQDLSLYDTERTAPKVKNLKAAKEAFLTAKFNCLYEETSNAISKRCMLLNKEKGAGSWLTALPLKDHGYCLNKQEFRDAVSLRYGWRIANTAQFCACGKENTINHSQICLKGGFVNSQLGHCLKFHKNCANCDKSMKFGTKVPKTNTKKMANGDQLNFSFLVPIMTP